MELALQSSLFDHAERRNLGSGAWVEVRSGWLTDAESLFGELMQQIPWRAERRQMYQRTLDVPRLVSFHSFVDEPAPHPRLKQIRRGSTTPMPANSANRSPLRGCASTVTATTASHGTATRSAAAPPKTPWWPS